MDVDINGSDTPVSEDSTGANQTVAIANKIDGIPIEDFTKNGFGFVMEAMRCTNAFPSGPTRTLYSAHPAFNKIVESTSEQIVGIISKVLKLENIKGNIQRRDNDEKFELLLECNDVMLERINSNLDELAGIKKNPETVLVQSEIKTPAVQLKPISGSWNDSKASSAARTKITKLLTARNILRPQVNFRIPVDNSNANPFEPKLKSKPNSIKPLAILPEYDEDGNIESYLHPYEIELTKFEAPARQLVAIQPKEPLLLKDTPLIHVDTEAALKVLLDDLRGVSEFAVDVEHHSYRTFQGITCLLQISTRQKDYIVDTLALREELHLLNEVFTDPRIVKVLHGADSDVEWLQRDLSIYMVNMFDTHQAAKRMNLARLSLAFLLKQYCQLDIDKTFQLADWRIRPLPEELVMYARQDTHYLLYIYDLLTNDLLNEANGQTNLLQSVYQSSTEICKKRYIKPKTLADSYMDLYSKSKRVFDNRQMYALQALYMWRDKIARQEDESNGYVLPNHMMLQIAEILPREMQGILACCNPIPPLVRQNLPNLHQFVLKAREQPLVKPVLEEQNLNRGAMLMKNRDLTGHLFCPHDLTHNSEFRDDLPTLLGKNSDYSADEFKTKLKLAKRSALSVFDTPNNSDIDEVNANVTKINSIKFVSPFARYLAILPLAEKQRLEELAQTEAANKKKKLCPDKSDSLEEYVVIKREPVALDDVNEMPLKDYAKRRRNEEHVASPAVTKTPDVGSQASKRMRFNVTAASSSVDAESDEGNIGAQQNNEDASIAAASSERTPKKNRKNKTFVNNKTAQSSGTPVRFDYSQVDFKKFKGGSTKNKSNSNEVQTKFHGKNKNKRGTDKKFNKLLTFDKVGKK